MLVVHITPESVLNTEQYKEWMERFVLHPDFTDTPALFKAEFDALSLFLQVFVHNRAPDPERTSVHSSQHQKSQDSDSAQHDSPRDLSRTEILENKGNSWSLQDQWLSRLLGLTV